MGRRGRERRERPAAPRPRGPRGETAKGDGPAEPPNHLWEWTKSILVALVLFLIIRSFLVQTFVITSGSMEETLLVGDFLVVNRMALGSRIPGTQLRVPGYSEPRRGGVLVFDPPHEDRLRLVKRLIGMPEDTLQMRDKVLYVNGQAQEEPYVRHADPTGDEVHPWMEWQRQHLAGGGTADYRPTRDNWGPIVVPPGHYFMLGDNRDTSLDSRYWGLLERWRLEGRSVFIYFSYAKGSLRPFPWIREVRWGRIGSRIR